MSETGGAGQTPLIQRKCKPCTGQTPRLTGKQLEEYRARLGPEWQLVDEHHLEKGFKFDGWGEARDFVNRIADVAEQEDHHPDVLLSYGKVHVTLLTHKIDGLSENDFILAAKIDELPRG